LESGAIVIAVEKDDELYESLKQEYAEEILSERLVLIHDDILRCDLTKLVNGKYKLMANIPYNITGAILKKFLGADCQPERMVLLVQKEVAERIVGKTLGSLASKLKESILSISVKAYGTPRYIETVKAGSFVPMPKVDSAILLIESISKEFFQNMARNNNLEVELPSEEMFFRLLKAGFKSKRKKLSSNLSTIFKPVSVKEVFNKLNLDENTRAEDVDVETWYRLAQNL
jgi:16S rRNA (adenine1518-N6/adenine1519-N6)-dimethyltransferase